jgi:hypothetical protein
MYLENPFLLQKTNLGSLGKTSYWDIYTGDILQKDHESAVLKIRSRLLWNQGASCFPIPFGSNCFKVPEVDIVLKIYENLAASQTIPEYDRKNNIAAIVNIEKTVSAESGIPENRVATILFELYAASNDGKLPYMNSVIAPYTAKHIEEKYGKTGPSTDSMDKSVMGWDGLFGSSGLFDSIGTYVKWILIGGVSLAVVGGIFYIYKWLPKKQNAN